MSPRLLTVTEAADALGVSTRTLQRRIAQGQVAVFRDGGIVRIPERALGDYIGRRTRPVAEERPRRQRATTSRPRPRAGDPPPESSGRVVRLWEQP